MVKIFKKFRTDLDDCSVFVFPKEIPMVDFKTVEIVFPVFRDCLRYPGVSKDKCNWFVDLGDTSKKPEIMQMGVFGVSHKQIEKV